MKEYTYRGKEPLRLDKFIGQQVPGLPQNLLHKYLRQNKIKLNGKKTPLATRLAPGDVVRLYLPEDFVTGASARPTPPLGVLFEDDNLLAVYKPAGLLSLEEAGQHRDNLFAQIQRYLAEKGNSAVQTAALCHRLDTGTSGVLLAAKNRDTLDFVTELIAQNQLAKTYYALSFGHPKPAFGVVEGYLYKDAQSGIVQVAHSAGPNTRLARTSYATTKLCGPLALLQVTPHTGRTHQIRAHMAHLGTPLLGDSKYGNQEANRRYRCRYQCLCAGALSFPLIGDGPYKTYSQLRITCPKPWFYTQALDDTLRPAQKE